MTIDRRLQNPGNAYDTDDPDNYLNRDRLTESSNLVPWMMGAMFAVATVIGLFFAEESPLTHKTAATLTTENVPGQPYPDPFRAN
ncbi:MAG: hypothetical protein U1E67_22955 [Hyphomicrobiales bacterium]